MGMNEDRKTGNSLAFPAIDKSLSDMKTNGFLDGPNAQGIVLNSFDVVPLTLPGSKPVSKEKQQKTR